MTIRCVQCYIVTCDDCRRQFDETDVDYVVHFDTETQPSTSSPRTAG